MSMGFDEDFAECKCGKRWPLKWTDPPPEVRVAEGGVCKEAIVEMDCEVCEPNFTDYDIGGRRRAAAGRGGGIIGAMGQYCPEEYALGFNDCACPYNEAANEQPCVSCDERVKYGDHIHFKGQLFHE